MQIEELDDNNDNLEFKASQSFISSDQVEAAQLSSDGPWFGDQWCLPWHPKDWITLLKSAPLPSTNTLNEHTTVGIFYLVFPSDQASNINLTKVDGKQDCTRLLKLSRWSSDYDSGTDTGRPSSGTQHGQLLDVFKLMLCLQTALIVVVMCAKGWTWGFFSGSMSAGQE